jgi:hypothetical protein
MVVILPAGGPNKTELFRKITYYLVIGLGIITVFNQLEITDELQPILF